MDDEHSRGGTLSDALPRTALHAQFGVLAAEDDVVRHDHLWPRPLPGVAAPTDTNVQTTYREKHA